jgi:hypothetical protein
MRTFNLLIVLLCGMVSVCAAGDAVRQNSSSQPAENSFTSDLISPSARARYDFLRLPVADGADQYFSRADSERDGDVICYTMHTFLVKRESPHSDVTEPAGEATCLSGPRYSVRKADDRDKAPSR